MIRSSPSKIAWIILYKHHLKGSPFFQNIIKWLWKLPKENSWIKNETLNVCTGLIRTHTLGVQNAFSDINLTAKTHGKTHSCRRIGCWHCHCRYRTGKCYEENGVAQSRFINVVFAYATTIINTYMRFVTCSYWRARNLKKNKLARTLVVFLSTLLYITFIRCKTRKCLLITADATFYVQTVAHIGYAHWFSLEIWCIFNVCSILIYGQSIEIISKRIKGGKEIPILIESILFNNFSGWNHQMENVLECHAKQCSILKWNKKNDEKEVQNHKL